MIHVACMDLCSWVIDYSSTTLLRKVGPGMKMLLENHFFSLLTSYNRVTSRQARLC